MKRITSIAVVLLLSATVATANVTTPFEQATVQAQKIIKTEAITVTKASVEFKLLATYKGKLKNKYYESELARLQVSGNVEQPEQVVAIGNQVEDEVSANCSADIAGRAKRDVGISRRPEVRSTPAVVGDLELESLGPVEIEIGIGDVLLDLELCDQLTTSDDYLLQAVRYVHRNPIDLGDAPPPGAATSMVGPKFE